MNILIARAAVALALASGAGIASADVVSFTGSMTGLGVTGPDASCAPLPFRGTIAASSTSGSSNLGAFSYSHSICLNGSPGISVGSFTINFGTGSILGDLTGTATPDAAIPGVSDTLFNYTILGGTGQFLGATGTFTGTGTADPRVQPALIALGFAGNINAPALPEPATWAMMLLGFGAVGLSLRRRRNAEALRQLA